MIKIAVYDFDKLIYKEIMTTLKSYEFRKKYCKVFTDNNGKNHGLLFIAWTSKKRNYNCWHY